MEVYHKYKNQISEENQIDVVENPEISAFKLSESDEKEELSQDSELFLKPKKSKENSSFYEESLEISNNEKKQLELFDNMDEYAEYLERLALDDQELDELYSKIKDSNEEDKKEFLKKYKRGLLLLKKSSDFADEFNEANFYCFDSKKNRELNIDNNFKVILRKEDIEKELEKKDYFRKLMEEKKLKEKNEKNNPSKISLTKLFSLDLTPNLVIKRPKEVFKKSLADISERYSPSPKKRRCRVTPSLGRSDKNSLKKLQKMKTSILTKIKKSRCLNPKKFLLKRRIRTRRRNDIPNIIAGSFSIRRKLNETK